MNALNHKAHCAIYDGQHCTCGFTSPYRTAAARSDFDVSPAAGDVLVWNGSHWAPTPRVEAAESAVERLTQERDEARAQRDALVEEIKKLRNALAAISLDEYESTSSASEKVHGHARIARRALHGEEG